MDEYIILYKVPEPHQTWEDTWTQTFTCQADDKEHAMDQCIDAYPKAVIWRVYVEV